MTEQDVMTRQSEPGRPDNGHTCDPYTVLCTYLVKPDKIDVMRRILDEHWPLLRRLGFVTDDPPAVYFGEDSHGPFFVEILTWVDPKASSRAYWVEDVNRLWSQLYEHTEARGARPAIEYPEVEHLIVNGRKVPVSDGRARADHAAPDSLDWDDLYRQGRDAHYWGYAHPSPELVAYAASSSLAPGATALDLGCGTGKDALFLAEAGIEVSAVDISAEAIRIAASADHHNAVSWCQSDALSLPFPDEHFDFINDRGCFHHVAPSDHSRYAQEVARVLKCGGCLLLRGCAVDQFPFFPVTLDVVTRVFGTPELEAGPVFRIHLVTTSGSLDGNIVTIRRRPRQ